MPWWIWLVLVVFMLVMLIAGLAYAALHLWQAFGKVSRIGAVIGEHVAAFQDTAPSEERREAMRSRHVEAWARWRRFNND